MARQRKVHSRKAGWMLAVMFNSLLILLPVIGARAVANAYDQDLTSREGAAEALQNANEKLLSELAGIGPRDENSKLPYWQDRIVAELDARNMSAVRGYMLAAPQMLGRDLGEQIRVRAEAEISGTPDERLIRAAMQKLPEAVAARIMETERYNPPVLSPAAETAPADAAGAGDTLPAATPDTAEAAAAGPEDSPEASPPPADEPIVLQANVRSEDERRFQTLGSYADLSNMSQNWIEGDRSDELVVKLTGLGLVQQDYSDGLSDAAALSVSILKSARRSQRLTASFAEYLETHVDAALPDAALEPALQEAFSELATTEVRAERVRVAYAASINQAGLGPLESDLDQIQRLAAQTSPGGALTILAVIEDGTDLQRARLLAEAGGERLIVLVREQGRDALRIADAGISWNRNTVLEIMSLTAAGMLLFWVMLSTVRLYIKLPKPRAEPQGA